MLDFEVSIIPTSLPGDSIGFDRIHVGRSLDGRVLPEETCLGSDSVIIIEEAFFQRGVRIVFALARLDWQQMMVR